MENDEVERNRTNLSTLTLKKLKEGEDYKEHYPQYGFKEGDWRMRYERPEYTLKNYEDHIRIYANDPRKSNSEWFIKFYDESPKLFKRLNDIKTYLAKKI